VDTIAPSALDALPIFPLPDAVLFPGTLLPLHVFEPRYRDLTAQVLAGNRLMAIARLRPGYQADYQGRPPVFAVAGVGYVIGDEKLPDGRYNIILRGVGRVIIERELPPDKSFREVRARMLVDTHSGRADALPVLHEQLIALCDRLSMALDAGGDDLRQLVRALPSPAGCADVLSAAMITDPDQRQALLEALDPADRLEQVTVRVTALLLRLGPAADTLN
jgi:Lon protease-like protein